MNHLRPDLKAIADLVPPDVSVLDVGCGEGDLLAWLMRQKQVRARGIELSAQGVARSISKGLSVIQGDANQDMSEYPDKAYDYVVLSQTLQTLVNPKETLDQLIRIGRHVIVSVPNFGHWRNRVYLALHGRMPVTKTLSYQWYDTPNIHFCTITDFIALCDMLGIEVEKRVYVTDQGVISNFTRLAPFANLFGQQGIFLIRR